MLIFHSFSISQRGFLACALVYQVDFSAQYSFGLAGELRRQ